MPKTPSPWGKKEEANLAKQLLSQSEQTIHLVFGPEELPPHGEAIVVVIVNKDDMETGEGVGRAVSNAFEQAIGHRYDLEVSDVSKYNISYMWSKREPRRFTP